MFKNKSRCFLLKPHDNLCVGVAPPYCRMQEMRGSLRLLNLDLIYLHCLPLSLPPAVPAVTTSVSLPAAGMMAAEAVALGYRLIQPFAFGRISQHFPLFCAERQAHVHEPLGHLTVVRSGQDIKLVWK